MSDVSILPKGAIINESLSIEEQIQPTKTYGAKDGKIIGFCDDKESLMQTIYFILNSERYTYIVYPNSYGNEILDTIGMDQDIAESELKRRVKEALIQDDRINDVTKFEFVYDGDSELLKCTVFSIYGELDIEKEVS